VPGWALPIDRTNVLGSQAFGQCLAGLSIRLGGRVGLTLIYVGCAARCV
jgi:hypothetical protein